VGEAIRARAEREDDREDGVIELHLIGYTEDLELLVLDRAPDGDGAYTVPVDPDLLATLEQLLEQRQAVDVEVPSEALAPPVALRAPEVATHAALSPAEIQTQLRAGRSVRAVARDAGTDVAWVERWLAPILAERDRVLREARETTAGPGRSRRPFGDVVNRNLADRGADGDRARWEAVRREDGLWRITVRFDDAGRARSATWIYDRGEGALLPQSPLATELSGPRRRGARGRGDGPARPRS
jgi:hypothetical protein